MCGIFGFIGNPDAISRRKLFRFLTALMVETQSRGRHATGWAAMNKSGIISGDKNGLPSTDYVTTPAWQGFMDSLTPFFVGHCRNATIGDPKINDNNHPFFSSDGRYALIHNGVIRGHKKIAAVENFELRGECDSEILLRIIESKGDPLKAITSIFRDVFSYLQRDGACAVLDSKNRKLHVFRNSMKPCYMIRLPQFDNSVFFASTKSIFRRAYATIDPVSTIPEGFELKPERIYTLGFNGIPGRPTIDTTDVQIQAFATGHFFADQLPAPGRRRRQMHLWPVGFDEIPDYGPEQIKCECGNVVWLWAGEKRICTYCGDYELSTDIKPLRITSDDDDFLRLRCQICGQVWEQRRVFDLKCLKCNGTWVEVTGIRRGKEKKSRAVSVWSCTKCGLQMILDRSPVTCAKCGNSLFQFEGEIKNGIIPGLKHRSERPQFKKCHDCSRMIPIRGASRCEKCREKRRRGRKND